MESGEATINLAAWREPRLWVVAEEVGVNSVYVSAICHILQGFMYTLSDLSQFTPFNRS